eukprot:COSAG05_NODE_2671_length_2779_cov_154.767164_5_plen_58_part_00
MRTRALTATVGAAGGGAETETGKSGGVSAVPSTGNSGIRAAGHNKQVEAGRGGGCEE